MADLDKRSEYEEELFLLLLLLWASYDSFFWFRQPPSIRWFGDQIQRRGITRLAGRIARQQTGAFLDEIQWDRDRRILLRGLNIIGEQYESDLARRMTRIHREWVSQTEVARRTDIQPPLIEDIYTETQARRESVTSVTTIVSETELFGRDRLRSAYGVEIETTWELDPRSNWCERCLALAGSTESVWSVVSPKGPPLHVRCACFLSHTRVLSNSNVTLP